MPNLIGKLNVLVRSSVQSVLGDDPKPSRRQRQTPLLSRLGKDIDHEIAALREKVNVALDDEDRLAAELETLKQRAADWDKQADQAVQKGDEATARHAIHQMQLQQQRAAMLQAELEQHRYETSELISRVNELDAVVAEARSQPAPTSDEEADEPLSIRLRQARQTYETQEMEALTSETPVIKVSEAEIEDDLARRRARLSL
ncbi:MAG TPA: PspA/IM30 family protein [Aggregatilineaceae bacterium]|nr:PspA/IM30 family protein [Aggregatilineaceae bacterium]